MKVKIAFFILSGWMSQGCTTTLNATTEVSGKPLVKHSEFSATTISRDTLYMCDDKSPNSMAVILKSLWDNGTYDEPNTPRPAVIVLDCSDYERMIEPRLKYNSREVTAFGGY